MHFLVIILAQIRQLLHTSLHFGVSRTHFSRNSAYQQKTYSAWIQKATATSYSWTQCMHCDKQLLTRNAGVREQYDWTYKTLQCLLPKKYARQKVSKPPPNKAHAQAHGPKHFLHECMYMKNPHNEETEINLERHVHCSSWLRNLNSWLFKKLPMRYTFKRFLSHYS